MRKAIKLNSYWGVTTRSVHNDRKSDTLVVILPGINYTLEQPLLKYTEKLSLELGYDVLGIEYGFQVANEKLDLDTEIVVVIKESRRIFNKAMDNKYKKVIFVGKSIGTVVQNFLQQDKIDNCKFFNIYLTPIDETVERIETNSLIISGTKDSHISKENRDELKENCINNFVEIEEGNHSLEIEGDLLKTIDILKYIIEEEKKFMEKIKNL